MGLTIAETFMLIAFALLMLLALWRSESDNALRKMREDLAESRAELAALQQFSSLSVEYRRLLVALMENNGYEILKSLGMEGLGNLSRNDIVELINRLKLMEDSELRRLVEAVSVWPTEERAQLLELVILNPDQQSISDVIAMLESGVTPEAIRKALSTMDDESEAQALRENIKERLQIRLERQRKLATATKAALGDHVRRLGGYIDENGVITLPDGVLFEVGKDEPRPDFRRFLSVACPPWFEAMMALPFDVGEVRIEGHASTEWGPNSSSESAYFNNLDLSQRRAGRVLQDCLGAAGTTEGGMWARERATASGFSSSRPIRNDEGIEDRVRSRRVVFMANAVSDDIFANLDGVAEGGDSRVDSSRR